MSKVAVLFAGGGVLDAAIREAGLTVSLAVEGDPERVELSKAIADCYALNYGDTHLIRTPVEKVIWSPFMGDKWMLLHASPSCKNFSNANFDGMETDQDVVAARAIVKAVESLRPYYFTLEQVRGYVNTVSWQIITRGLKNLGYSLTYDILNSYFYGVPQERERLVLTSCRNGTPVGLPPMTRPVSWGEVLCHRIGDMDTGKPTPAQIKALDEMRSLYPNSTCFLVQRRGNHSKPPAVRHFWQTAPVVTCSIFTDDKGANRQSFLDVWVNGEWRTLSIRDVAQLQTIPDWYKLPPKTAIAGAVIGNGVPPKLYEAVLRQLMSHYQSH